MEIETDPLFRREVTEHVTNRLYGEVLVRPKLSHLLVTTVCVIWVLLCGYFVTSIQWDERVSIQGLVSVSGTGDLIAAQVFVPYSLTRHIQADQVYVTALDGIPNARITLRIDPASREIASNTLGESTANSFVVRYQAVILDRELPAEAPPFSSAEDMRIHLMLDTGKMTVLQLLLRKLRGSERD